MRTETADVGQTLGFTWKQGRKEINRVLDAENIREFSQSERRCIMSSDGLL